MAILNKIRQRSLVLILVIALALFAFVIGDVFRNSDGFGGSQDIVATINGEDIKREPFMRVVQFRQQQSGGRSSDTQIKNQVYNQELERIVLNTEFDKLGLSIERDKMRELLESNFGTYPEFQNQDSIFDINKLNAFIANLKDIQPAGAPFGSSTINYAQWTNNEQALADRAIRQQYYNLIKAGVNATVAEAEYDYIAGAETRNVKYVQIPYSSIADSTITVSDSDIKDYMKRNEDTYTVEASRELLFVEFREDASEEDENNLKSEILSLKANRLEFNDVTKGTDTIYGFDNADDIEAFVNANSDIKFSNSFLRPSQLGTAKDSLLNTPVGGYYGPYKDDQYFKLSKVLETERRPDSVKVRHILIPYAGSASAAPDVVKTSEEAKVTADSIFGVLKNNRGKFVDLLELSSDKVSNENEGVIEFTYNQGYAAEFKAFSFDNKVGDMDVVETAFGFHIIEILDQSGFNNTIKLATIARQIEASEKTIDDVFNAKQKFEIAAADGDFRELAKDRELEVKSVTLKELDENIPGVGSQRQIVRWAYENDTKLGDYKSFPVAGVGFVIAQLVDVNEAGLMKVDDARVAASTAIRKEKKAEQIKQNFATGTIDEIAAAQGQTVRTAGSVTLSATNLSGAGDEPKVIGAAFGLKQGGLSKPIAGNQGVYVVQVTQINEATKLDNYAASMGRINSTRKNAAQSKVFNALKEAAEVEDNRAKTVY